MKLIMVFLLLLGGIGLTSAPLRAQAPQSDPSITATRAIGEVKSVDAAKKEIVVKTDAGSAVTVIVSDTTAYLRLAPGETTMEHATTITLGDISEGDRIYASGKTAEDFKSIPSRRVVMMSKGDIGKKQEKERLEWRQRGILGVIAAIKPDTKEVTITTRSAAGTQPVIIPISEKVDMRRYAPDSIKFSDAKTSDFTELKVGDQVRALGDKSTDGTHFTPEKVVTGAFRTVAGTVTAIDTATGEIKINELEKKQPLTIVIKQDSVLRRFPAEFGAMMGGPPGGAGGPGGPGGQGAAGGGGAAGGQGAPANRPAGGPGGSGGGRGNIADML